MLTVTSSARAAAATQQLRDRHEQRLHRRGTASTKSSWTTTGSKIVVTSVGYYPDEGEPGIHTGGADRRTSRSRRSNTRSSPQTALDIKNNATVTGDIYSDGDVSVGQNATICGSILSSEVGCPLANDGQIVTSNAELRLLGEVGQRLDRRLKRASGRLEHSDRVKGSQASNPRRRPARATYRQLRGHEVTAPGR